MKNTFFAQLIFVLTLCILAACRQNQKQETLSADLNTTEKVKVFVQQNMNNAVQQYKLMMSRLPEGRFPRSYDEKEDHFVTSGSDWWCSGFYPGTLLYLYEETKEQVLYDEAMRILKDLEKEKLNTHTHDLGFMMYCSFGNAHRISPSEEYKEILLTSAKSLASRFNPKVGCIRSWDSAPEDFLVIIDNMMNLELLFWATRETGDSTFYDIAVTHANTTLKNHFRNDNSSYHLVNYDPLTGQVKGKKTVQGAADESAWARGQAWGLYGYTTTYRDTNDKKYLAQAEKIADFMLDHANMPDDKVPFWDYNAPGIPDALRDASAGAILASGLLELSQYVNPQKSEKYLKSAQTILNALARPAYQAAPGSNGGFILKHSVGHFSSNSEVDVPLTYADYYFVEALKRLKEPKVK